MQNIELNKSNFFTNPKTLIAKNSNAWVNRHSKQISLRKEENDFVDARHTTENDEGVARGYVEESSKEHNEADTGIIFFAIDFCLG